MKLAVAIDWSSRQQRLIWLGAAYRLAVAALLPPLAHAASSLGYELDRVVQELDNQSYQTQTLHPVLPELLQEVLLAVAPGAEKCQIGLTLFMVLIFEGSVFDAARQISDLSEPVEARSRFTVYQGLPPQRVFECPMQGVRNQALPVVVVNLHSIKLLESLQALKEELDDVALHFLPKRRSICELAFPIHKRLVAEGHAPSKRGEAEQIARPRFNVLIGKVLISVRQGHEVERLVLQSTFAKQPLIASDFLRDVICLIVKHERRYVVLGVPAQIAGLIYEDGKLTHRESLQKQESRGDSPALDGSPCMETHLRYTTRRFGNSIIPKSEHMFSIIDTNICSTYRKAA